MVGWLADYICQAPACAASALEKNLGFDITKVKQGLGFSPSASILPCARTIHSPAAPHLLMSCDTAPKATSSLQRTRHHLAPHYSPTRYPPPPPPPHLLMSCDAVPYTSVTNSPLPHAMVLVTAFLSWKLPNWRLWTETTRLSKQEGDQRATV